MVALAGGARLDQTAVSLHVRLQEDRPDALHLAIAATAGVNLSLTNDRRLHRLKIPGIDFIAGLDTNLY